VFALAALHKTATTAAERPAAPQLRCERSMEFPPNE
jgi:hypothetical protein